MKYRNVEWYYQQALDDAGTKIMDFKTKEPISAIRLTFVGTNGATHNKDNRLNDVITKVEIVDGSDQLVSLTLKELQALEFRRTGKMPFMRPGELGGGGQEESVLILFGRKLWDNEYYLDLTKFTNPQLKITTNIAAVRAAAATAFLAGSLKVTVDLYTIPEGAAPAKGFMMTKNVRSFTSGTSGDEPTSLPKDYPYVGLMLRAFTAGNDVDENISKLKIDCDTGKFIPLEKYIKDIYKAEEEDLGPAELHYYLYRKDNETVTHDLNHDPIVSVMGRDANDVINVNTCWSSRFTLRFYTGNTGAAVVVEELLPFIVRGSCPHSTIYVPFGLRGEPDTYFNPKDYEDISLILTQAAASAVSIILEQLRSYPAA